MKNILAICVCLFSFSSALWAQRDSLFMFDMNVFPKGGTIKVYIYLEGGVIDTKMPFGYFKNGERLTEKDIRKEYRIKLKRNKAMHDKESYIFKYKGLKGITSFANYGPKCKEYLFFTPLEGKGSYKITRFDYVYEDETLKKLKNIRVLYQNIGTGSIKIRDYKP